MKKKNKGAISIFALLSMMFFLIFIMVAYNNVMQKGKTQVETEGILVDYYKSTRTAAEITSAAEGNAISTDSDEDKKSNLKEKAERDAVNAENAAASPNKYVYSNGKVHKIQ